MQPYPSSSTSPHHPQNPVEVSHFIVNRLKNASLLTFKVASLRPPQVRPLPLAAARTHVRRVPVNVDQRGKPLSARASLLILNARVFSEALFFLFVACRGCSLFDDQKGAQEGVGGRGGLIPLPDTQ